MNSKSVNRNPTLSLCMIVKDEEKFLPACLESIKDHVDEIIVVDTGSTDRTVEIARKYGAKVYHHPWENSFSKARNYSLKYAACDWIMWIDADEVVDKRDAHKLKDVIKDDEVDVIYLPMFNGPIGGKATSIFSAEKIFRNHIGIHFEGIVHNSLKYSGPDKNVNIRLYHYGYHQGEEQMEKKFNRTSTLLKEQIRNNPENPVPHHNLAISYLDRQRHEECIQEALEAIRLFELQNSSLQLRLLAYQTASVAFYREQDLTNAEIYALKAIDFHPDYLDAHCILSSIYFLRKEYDKCSEATSRYLKSLKSIESNPSKALVIPYSTILHAWLAHSRMAINHYEQGNEKEGLQSLKNAINCADNAWEPYLTIGKHFMEHNNHKMAERFLKDGLKHDQNNKAIQYYLTGTLFNLAVSYEMVGDITQAKDTYNDILKIKPEYPEVFVRLGTLYLNECNHVKAEECFLNTIKLDKYLLEAHLALSKIYIALDVLESCVISCDELLKCLDLPRNIAIDSVSDLSKLYISIGETLKAQQKELLANVSFEIAALIDPVVIDKNYSPQSCKAQRRTVM